MGHTIIILLMATVGQGVLKNLGDTRHAGENDRARYAAFAGVQRALAEIRLDPNWGSASWGVVLTYNLPQEPGLTYECKVFNNTMGVAGKVANIGAQNITVPPGQVYVVTSGYDAMVPANVRSLGGMAGSLLQRTASFDNSSVTDSRTSLLDSIVDAYDRTKGKWDGYSVNNSAGIVAIIPKRATIIMNKFYSLSGANTKLDGHGERINTDGVDPNTLTAVPYDSSDGTATITDTSVTNTAPDQLGIKRNTSPQIIPAIVSPIAPVSGRDIVAGGADPDITGGVLKNGKAYNKLTVPPGKSITLKSGRYFFDSIDMDNGEIQIDSSKGPVIVYVGQEMKVANGSTVNKDGYARNLQVYFTDEKPDETAPGVPRIDNDPTSLNFGLPVLNEDGTPRTKSDCQIVNKSSVCMVSAGKHTDYLVGSNLASDGLGGYTGSGMSDSSDFFGAVIGNEVVGVEGRMHYDTSLKGAALGLNAGWVLDGVHDLR